MRVHVLQRQHGALNRIWFVIPLLWGEPLDEALLRAMTFMVVASPRAVVLATMPSLLAAIANAGRHGVLVKSAVVMERLGATTRVAFDKTATLTRVAPELAELHPRPGHADDELLRLAAAAERSSEHPPATAIVRAARRLSLHKRIDELEAEVAAGTVGAIEALRSLHTRAP